MNDNSATVKRTVSSKAKLTPEERKRKRRQQISTGVIVLVAALALAVVIQGKNPKGAFIWMIGIAFGYVLQRSRFCFTASLRDPLLTGGTDLTKAVIIALSLSTVAFMALNMARFGMDLAAFDIAKVVGNVKPVGLGTVIGAFVFGIGAVIAGGCASGTLMRMGEGFAQQWLAFVFFVVGSVIGAVLKVPMNTVPIIKGVPVFLPAALGGWVPALVIQFGLLAGCYILAMWWQRKKAGA